MKKEKFIEKLDKFLMLFEPLGIMLLAFVMLITLTKLISDLEGITKIIVAITTFFGIIGFVWNFNMRNLLLNTTKRGKTK